jgi:hypothetical protein
MKSVSCFTHSYSYLELTYEISTHKITYNIKNSNTDLSVRSVLLNAGVESGDIQYLRKMRNVMHSRICPQMMTMMIMIICHDAS